MVQKIYFPRLVIPLSKAMVGLIDFGITLVIILLVMLAYQYPPSTEYCISAIIYANGVVCALGAGIWLSALTIRFRDFQQIVPFLVRFGMFFTPVAYPAEVVLQRLPDWAAVIYYLNPIAGVVEGFRWSIVGGNPPSRFAYVSFIVVILLFLSSLFYFKKVEKIIADIV